MQLPMLKWRAPYCSSSFMARGSLFQGGHTLSKTAVGRTRPTMDSFVSMPCNIVCNLKYRVCRLGRRFIFHLNCGVIRGVLLRWLDQGSFVPRRMAGFTRAIACRPHATCSWVCGYTYIPARFSRLTAAYVNVYEQRDNRRKIMPLVFTKCTYVKD